MLGLLREGTGIAAGVLQSLAVNLEMARAQLIEVLERRILPVSGAGPAPELPIPPPVPADAAALVSEDQAALTCGRCGARCPAYFRFCFNCGHGLPARERRDGEHAAME